MEERKTREERAIGDAIKQTDPLVANSIEALVEVVNGIDGALDAKVHAFRTLRASVAYSDRMAHIDAILGARNLELFAKNKLLAEVRSDWIASSPSGLAPLAAAADGLVRQHASELVNNEWASLYELRELSELTGRSQGDLAVVLIEAASGSQMDGAAPIWLKLASLLAPRTAAVVPRAALDRLLNSGAARLADGVGDGPWTSSLDPGDDPDRIVAGLIWFRLGSPRAGDRWRAAHAVRALARFGRWSVVDALFELFDSGGGGAFQDQRLPFFVMHAQQWFMLSVARLALDYPNTVARQQKRLKRIALNDEFPHVAMREAARKATLSTLRIAKSQTATRLRERLSKVNKSRFRARKATVETFGEMSWNRPANIERPTPHFHFDYDFDKHDLSKVGGMFGLRTWQVADRCTEWIRLWDSKIENMHDFGGRDRPSGSSQYSVGAEESLQSYGAYLARHALALEAGRLLLTTPLRRSRYSDDRWEDWLSRYSPTRSNGLWLADGLDPFPEFSLHDLLAEGGQRPQPIDDRELLTSIVGVSANNDIETSLLIDGYWSSPDHVTVSVSSVLVPVRDADICARAVVTAPPMHMWLPNFEADGDKDSDFRIRHKEMAPLEPWTTDVQAFLRIDEYDPFGSQEAVQRSRPARHIVDTFELRASKPWPRVWSTPDKRRAFEALAWGRRIGDGDRETTESGSALLSPKDFLAGAMSTLDLSLILLVKLQHYRERSHAEGTWDDPAESFSHAYIVLTVDKSLKVSHVRPSSDDIEAVQSLDEHSRCDFDERLRAIRRALSR